MAHRSLLILLALLLSAAGASAQILNGSFEPDTAVPAYQALPGGSTAIPGWTTLGTGVEWFDPVAYGFAAPPAGDFVVDLANYTYSDGGLEQTFATVPGAAYQILFWLGTHASSGRDGTCEIVVEADGVAQTFAASNPTGAIAWELMVFAFTADDAEATLSLRCLQNANLHFAYVDGLGAAEVVGAEAASLSEVKRTYR